MTRRLILLLAMALAMTALASVTVDAEDPTLSVTEDVDLAPAFSVLHNATLSCSVKLPSGTLGCFLERPVFVLGGLEVAVGVDAQAVLTGGGDAHLAPYGIIAYYADTWSAWLEVMLPELGVPVLGAPDWMRVGFTYRFKQPP